MNTESIDWVLLFIIGYFLLVTLLVVTGSLVGAECGGCAGNGQTMGN